MPEHKKIEGEKRIRNEGWRLKEIQKVKEVILLYSYLGFVFNR